ncbi:anti-sigma factor domain-containing protein [Bacillus inaquosorum]|uniref:anti-sigma factor domain-containing protein n=1 Tax=Bacillus inaquosorum TaxID=483913 RepID=UPI00227F3973|nr:anti-sigma factor domain-containing protein [Bacillus inaquosorum]MCY8161254.1 anti-sigma factor domain-containing protein [Bacillus inaquosorum]MCY8320915.1 anti-sigma factor domain-containing protein [Bacillus inaquosorum]MCY8336811.1 anti-sigma factor domain-containing protein [Bacillus inaquosorum]MCY8853357.1 anti-sigma factor domain-containing protein [Bacillus inaquosorum]
MKRGIIVEKNRKFVTLLTPDGQFLKAKNDRHSYEIGEEIMLPSESRMGRRASFFDFLKLRPFKMGIFTMTAIMLFIFIVLPVFSNNKAYAYMTIDINPSFEMALNSDYEVIELTPLNDEGKKVVNDIDDWEKTDFKKVIDDIITDCSEHGYVKESKEILISTVYENTEDNTYKTAVKKQLNDVTEKYKTTYRMESLESDMQTREKAKKEGVSTGSYIKSNEKNNHKDSKEDSSKPSGEEDQKSAGNEDETIDQTDGEDSKQGDNEQLDDTDSGEQNEDTTDDQTDDSDKDKDVKESDENTNAEKDGDHEQTPIQNPQDKGNEENSAEKGQSQYHRDWNNGDKGKNRSSSGGNNASDRRNPNGYSSNNNSAQTEDSPSDPGE